MNTKIVYVVVGNPRNTYIEQAWCSIWSAKYYNPSSFITIVSDGDTIEYIKKSRREGFLQMVDELVDGNVPISLSNMERSRWIKTNLRNIISGDFLFVDTDTLFTSNISEIDDLTCEIGMVKDWHIDFAHSFYNVEIKDKLEKIFNYNGPYPIKYFNSGVLYCKDTKRTRDFYLQWHSNWMHSKDKRWPFDQLSLFMTYIKNVDLIEEIDGIYNCQITASIEYLYKAKLIHFYTADSKLHPFKNTHIFENIRKEGCLSEDVQRQILNCKSLFASPSSPEADDIAFKFTRTYDYWCNWHKNGLWPFRLMEWSLTLLHNIKHNYFSK